MILELIWVAGQVLCILALLCGAFLALKETPLFLSFFRSKKRPASVPAMKRDLHSVKGFWNYVPDIHGSVAIDTQHRTLLDRFDAL